MAEGLSIEGAQNLSREAENDKGNQKGKENERRNRWETLVEVVEVLVLAIVAVATAWSGYQAAEWDGQQSLLYGHATADRFKVDAASTAGGQEFIIDASIFTAYLQARSAGDSTLEALYVRRFTPDYRVAFLAWLKDGSICQSFRPAWP